jgi:hypothetical protein
MTLKILQMMPPTPMLCTVFEEKGEAVGSLSGLLVLVQELENDTPPFICTAGLTADDGWRPDVESGNFLGNYVGQPGLVPQLFQTDAATDYKKRGL